MKFDKILKNRGLKATPQRILILNIIANNGHIDIEEIYNKIKKIIPSISIATIYKNLKILVDKKIIQEVNISSFKTLYEVNTSDHIHVICKKCKKIIDVNIDKKELSKDFKDKLKIDVEDFEISLFTICQDCKK